ncbi:MAG TPA: hypothetical protein HA359_00660 [Candidatus Poseidoniaceae archaeon]|nr:MAG TPA: hypothetical protein D7H84_00675 [Candidatus Poseidoniales archaeon]DAC61067.1 MAG TPA: hypothetical protein D7I03_01180 [Candidatus Poseidoniales archaeon]HII22749.1 hypothetical protein [Candidatus Poseidoniaceae archaeon]HII49932.1 hypothetical protein [Candidatus Poseidoniaceae archaeon]|tara:strand:- start:10702 stop:11784 length:1083 start_codon:yes stop_codon:yes gene_type:complete
MNIAYALAGEGRGHTTRAIGLADRLIEAGHKIQFFTCGDAVDLLEKRYGAESVTYLETPRFVLGKRGISYFGTAYATAKFIKGHRNRVKDCIKQLQHYQPDALISDFEPTFARAAKKLDKPIISFNSQRFSLDTKLADRLSISQRARLFPVRLLCKIFTPRPALSVISKGFNLEPKKDDVHLVGPMLRPQFFPGAWQPQGTHAVAYMRKSVLCHFDAIVDHARKRGLKVKLYGHKPEEIPEDVISCPISNQGFIDDLLSCDLIYQTAGSQLLGEVGVLGLPSLCIPEPGQVEQEINAVLASKAYANVAMLNKRKITVDDLDAALLSANIESPTIIFDNGVEGAYNAIQNFLDSRVTNIAS